MKIVDRGGEEDGGRDVSIVDGEKCVLKKTTK